MDNSERLALRWNDFGDNIQSTFHDLQESQNFTDVTLVCEDGDHMEAHKVILAASSPLFLNILTKLKNPHPMIYMKSIAKHNLSSVLSYIYKGEVSIEQMELDSFLVLAEELQLKGLTRNDTSQELENPKQTPTKVKVEEKMDLSDNNLLSVEETKNASMEGNAQNYNVIVVNNSEGIEELDRKIENIMERSDGGYLCILCGKRTKDKPKMRGHIEAYHIKGFTHECKICGRSYKSRASLQVHNSTSHRKVEANLQE